MVMKMVDGLLCIKIQGVWYFDAEGRKVLKTLFLERKELLLWRIRRQQA